MNNHIFLNFFKKNRIIVIFPLLICWVISAQHGFLQFHILKVFLVDYGTPAVELINGVLWEMLFKLFIQVFSIIILTFCPKIILKKTESPFVLIFLTIFNAVVFLIPWHCETLRSKNVSFHFFVSLLLPELTTVLIALFVTRILSNMFKSGYVSSIFVTEVVISSSSIVIPLTQIFTFNYSNFSNFQLISEILAAVSILITIICLIFLQKTKKCYVQQNIVKEEIPNISSIKKKLSAKFSKSPQDQVEIILDSARKGSRRESGCGDKENLPRFGSRRGKVHSGDMNDLPKSHSKDISDTLSRCGSSIIYGTFESFFIQSFRRKNPRSELTVMPSRQRTQFTDDQTQVLEETFRSCYYPNTETKKALAEKLGLVENRITVWFQNRRAKQRRHSKKESEFSFPNHLGFSIEIPKISKKDAQESIRVTVDKGFGESDSKVLDFASKNLCLTSGHICPNPQILDPSSGPTSITQDSPSKNINSSFTDFSKNYFSSFENQQFENPKMDQFFPPMSNYIQSYSGNFQDQSYYDSNWVYQNQGFQQ